jgi:methylenetetrahydrofolate dehydrogenase (NADP+)/methenyltetrahydrofolate cyclohydrolase
MEIIDGRKIRNNILELIKKEIQSLDFRPVFCDVMVGDDPASLQYVNMKAKIAESLGLEFHRAFFENDISTEDLIKEIQILNNIKNMCGIIVQLPLPPHLDTRAVLDAIDSSLDVDCLGSLLNNEFYQKKEVFLGLPTALACMYILDSLNLDLSSKNIVVLGQGELVGRPVSKLLKNSNIQHIVLNSESENKEEIIKNADIIISGIGQASYLKGYMLQKGVILIDAGTSESNGSLFGDVDIESVKDIASIASPVPGGVGPVTIAMLFKNVLEVAKNKKKQIYE